MVLRRRANEVGRANLVVSECRIDWQFIFIIHDSGAVLFFVNTSVFPGAKLIDSPVFFLTIS